LRFGIEDENDETIVEIYLKQINILPLPNAKLFKLYKQTKDGPQTQPIFVSKCATVGEVGKKICRLLSSYLYFVQKNKSVMVSAIRLWKANEDLHKLNDLDSKVMNYTHV
jgi:hypothetical protein